ncbi:MAG: hypothetical protein LUG18_01290 [Candidatus Azobacteroides sp.]|nr:hypothetical protein [Candidatus Azobacteroides sp.]
MAYIQATPNKNALEPDGINLIFLNENLQGSLMLTPMPFPMYFITIRIKRNDKFEYYRIYPFASSFPYGKWMP